MPYLQENFLFWMTSFCTSVAQVISGFSAAVQHVNIVVLSKDYVFSHYSEQSQWILFVASWSWLKPIIRSIELGLLTQIVCFHFSVSIKLIWYIWSHCPVLLRLHLHCKLFIIGRRDGGVDGWRGGGIELSCLIIV